LISIYIENFAPPPCSGLSTVVHGENFLQFFVLFVQGEVSQVISILNCRLGFSSISATIVPFQGTLPYIHMLCWPPFSHSIKVACSISSGHLVSSVMCAVCQKKKPCKNKKKNITIIFVTLSRFVQVLGPERMLQRCGLVHTVHVHCGKQKLPNLYYSFMTVLSCERVALFLLLNIDISPRKTIT